MLTATDIQLQQSIRSCLVCDYRTEQGQEVKGNSVSFLSEELRAEGWNNVSHLGDLESTCQRLGFKVVRAQGYRWGGRNGQRKLGRFAHVVTL